MTKETTETLIGAVVLASAFGFFLSLSGASGGSGGSYPLTAKFRSADGVTVGSDVRLSGVKVGSVSAVKIDPKTYRALVTLNIQQDVALPEDTSAKIASDGLLGGAYLALEPGGSDQMLAAGGEIEHTQGSISLLDLIGKAVHGATRQ